MSLRPYIYPPPIPDVFFMHIQLHMHKYKIINWLKWVHVHIVDNCNVPSPNLKFCNLSLWRTVAATPADPVFQEVKGTVRGWSFFFLLFHLHLNFFSLLPRVLNYCNTPKPESHICHIFKLILKISWHNNLCNWNRFISNHLYIYFANLHFLM